MANVQIPEPLRGLNLLTLPEPVDRLPQKPRLGTIPLPPVDPDHDGGGFDGGDSDDNFPGGGINDHQSIEQWTPPARWAEVTTSLAPTKPYDIENNIQSESSGPAPPSSSDGQDPTVNTEGRSSALSKSTER